MILILFCKHKKCLLKEIYMRNQYLFHLFISSNEELTNNEKQLFINYGMNIKSIFRKSILPKDYPNFEIY